MEISNQKTVMQYSINFLPFQALDMVAQSKVKLKNINYIIHISAYFALVQTSQEKFLQCFTFSLILVLKEVKWYKACTA